MIPSSGSSMLGGYKSRGCKRTKRVFFCDSNTNGRSDAGIASAQRVSKINGDGLDQTHPFAKDTGEPGTIEDGRLLFGRKKTRLWSSISGERSILFEYSWRTPEPCRLGQRTEVSPRSHMPRGSEKKTFVCKHNRRARKTSQQRETQRQTRQREYRQAAVNSRRRNPIECACRYDRQTPWNFNNDPYCNPDSCYIHTIPNLKGKKHPRHRTY